MRPPPSPSPSPARPSEPGAVAGVAGRAGAGVDGYVAEERSIEQEVKQQPQHVSAPEGDPRVHREEVTTLGEEV